MKILCSISSLEFTCEHFPGNLYQGEASHPIFNLPQKKLLSYLGKWGANELTPTDSYLLFLALLNSSELVQFRVPAIRTKETESIIALNMENLAKTVLTLNVTQNPSIYFPSYVITPDTKDLHNVQYWIQNWKDSYQEFKESKSKGLDDRDAWKKLDHRQSALERLIKNPHRAISSYSNQLADWAIIAGKFPQSNTISRINNQPCTIADYWKQIIIKASTDEGLFSLNHNDLEELIEHCETEIPIGTIYSNALFKVLRHAKEKHKNFLGLGDLTETTYEILNSSDSVEDANIRAIIQAAPENMPKLEDYPNKLAYMKAKLRYDMSRKYAKRSVQDNDGDGETV